MAGKKLTDKHLQDIIDNLSEVSEDEFSEKGSLNEVMNINQGVGIEKEVDNKSNKSKKDKVNIFWKNKILVLRQENDDSRRFPEEPDLDACANIVVRLARIILKNIIHQVFFDNYDTTIDLSEYLEENRILALVQ
ncbi:hypothetical protein HHI36_009536 [Cryptolaemus montrouzieri]|uniref:Uncharacterized protein n=1 Tax=Cryptolaemus montrouzieri TaxID=559131 RepID=A0ABD2MFZ3_9CUCU